MLFEIDQVIKGHLRRDQNREVFILSYAERYCQSVNDQILNKNIEGIENK